MNRRNAERSRPDRLRVLFPCTGDSCRSQMAEGWARALRGGVIEPYSAGLEPHVLDPPAAVTRPGYSMGYLSPQSARRASSVSRIDSVSSSGMTSLSVRPARRQSMT